MSTSGSYDESSTMGTIIKDAFSLIGVIDDAEPISADKWSYGKRKLNELMAFLSMHRGLWLIQSVTVTLVPGTDSYSMGVGETVDTPKPMRIVDARRVSSSIDIPIEVATRDDYVGIPNKTLQAPCNMVYYLPGTTTGTLYVWPTGTSTDKTLKITTQRPIQDFDSTGNNPDLPEEWVLAIQYMLAVNIAPKYLGGIVPPDVKANMQTLLSSLMAFDEEKESVFMGPK